ncbi:RDD family protein [Jidongwangia harbinensis]|uniref:RDD family protein n=1 Tax=Jidongwangia harbinensis TaxID=2878561 RepID=UPI001CD9954B|nr:RDD family protein [Jidongwangia harbinensis]MCA2213599.1 RDD family protein [Jidongwangia harbinensis]
MTQPYGPYPAAPHHPAPPGYRPPPPALSPGGQPLADFGTRLLAYLIDSAILFAVATLFATPVMFYFLLRWVDFSGGPADPGAFFGEIVGPLLLVELGLIAVLLIAYYVYYVEMMHRSGQTVGKKLLGIRVVAADPARRLTRTMAAKRYLVEFVAGTFVPLFVYLDGLWQLWDSPLQQTLHDKAAQTVVIKVSA